MYTILSSIIIILDERHCLFQSRKHFLLLFLTVKPQFPSFSLHFRSLNSSLSVPSPRGTLAPVSVHGQCLASTAPPTFEIPSSLDESLVPFPLSQPTSVRIWTFPEQWVGWPDSPTTHSRCWSTRSSWRTRKKHLKRLIAFAARAVVAAAKVVVAIGVPAAAVVAAGAGRGRTCELRGIIGENRVFLTAEELDDDESRLFTFPEWGMGMAVTVTSLNLDSISIASILLHGCVLETINSKFAMLNGRKEELPRRATGKKKQSDRRKFSIFTQDKQIRGSERGDKQNT